MKKYNGMGFVESLIAILVAGIAVVALMTMAANNMKEVIKNEREDSLTRLAMDGSVMVRMIAEEHSARTNKATLKFPNLTSNPDGKCYVLQNSGGTPSFKTTSTNVFYSNSLDGAKSDNNYNVDIVYNADKGTKDLAFRAYCIESVDGTLYVGRMVVGLKECEDCGVKDYEYPIVINAGD